MQPNLNKGSHPAWVRGLKPIIDNLENNSPNVAPCVGAWIETYYGLRNSSIYVVAPCVGAWIETPNDVPWSYIPVVAPCVGAWIETAVSARWL